jgi:hypothetical protein
LFRILSIDGGGIKGVFPAAFLATIESTLGRPIGSYFDLIAGTSTGGILAIGLGLGFSASDLLHFYETKAGLIFPPSVTGRFRHWVRQKYSPAPLRAALKEVLGVRLLGHSKTRLLIPSFNADNSEIHVYKTSHHPKLKLDWKVSAVDVAMATAAAPTYFPPHTTSFGCRFLDGGLWANNPTGFATVEAITILEQPASELQILSLGCTESPQSFHPKWFWSGKLAEAVNIIDATLTGQSFGSLGVAALIATHERVFRYSPIVEPGRFELDNSNIKELLSLGYTEARKALPRISPLFEAPASPFVPCYAP